MLIGRRAFLASSLSASLRMNGNQSSEEQNPLIRRAWQVALEVLKPGRKDLEHGLELHRNSLVIDCYGFAPRAALDGDTMRAAIEAGASDIELQDLREDMSMTRCVSSATEREEFERAWKASGVTCIFQNCGEESQDPLVLLKRLARYTYVTDLMRDFIFKAVTPDDILAAKKHNKRCLYFSTNGVPLTQAWVSVEDELRYIRVFFELGVRMMHITYNRRNMLGDGCAEPSNAGLSDLGRAAIAEMNRQGIIVDVAHAGWRTSLEAARISGRPIVASHTACAALNHHIRCKPDEVIRAIADSGGLVGICCVPRFLGRSEDIQALLDHVDYVARRFGTDFVAIGTDVAYTSQNAEAEIKKIPPLPRRRTPFAALWPPGALAGAASPRSESLAWTNWPLFTVGLVQRGYSDTEIQKILAGNIIRVARAVLPELKRQTSQPAG